MSDSIKKEELIYNLFVDVRAIVRLFFLAESDGIMQSTYMGRMFQIELLFVYYARESQKNRLEKIIDSLMVFDEKRAKALVEKVTVH